jgi:hypothetical protein
MIKCVEDAEFEASHLINTICQASGSLRRG